jgi:hypothetical protein
VVSRVRVRGAARQLSCRVGDRDLHAQARLEYQRLFRTLSRPDGGVRPHAGGALAKNIGTGGSQKRQSRASPQLEGGGSAGPRALGPAALGIWVVPTYSAPAGPSPGGLAWSLRRGPGAAGCPGGRCPGVQRDGRARRPQASPRVPGPPVAHASGYLYQIAAARKEPSCPQAYVWAIRRANSPHHDARESSPPGVTVRSESGYGRSVLRWTWGGT